MSDNLSLEDSKDVEKGTGVTVSSVPVLDTVRPDIVLEQRWGGKAGTFMKKLFDNGVEARGIERVPEDQRKRSHPQDNVMLWLSLQLPLGGVASGTLGTGIFYLSFAHSMAIIFIMTFIGGMTAALLAPWGPRTGLRTMVLTRFAGGFPGTFVFSCLNILTQLGYSVTNAVLGGQALRAITPGLPLEVGIIVTSVCAMVVSLFGYDYIHHWERYVWIPCLIIWCMVVGLGHRGDYALNAVQQDTGRALIGDVLSYMGIMFSVGSSWTTMICDYNAYEPADTSSTKIFFMTYCGIWIPCLFMNSLGAVLITVSKPDYVAAYTDGSVGGLIGYILINAWGGFGKFLMVFLALTAISVNVPNTYSTALSIQALWRPLAKVPRFLYTIVVTIVYLVAAIAGRQHFSAILSNLLALLSYWTAFFFVIVATELFYFRRVGGPLGPFDPNDVTNPEKLPKGYAAVLAMAFGAAGSVVGMAETYYIGPAALAIAKPYGGDIGFEMSAVCSGIVFFVVRSWEIRKWGR